MGRDKATLRIKEGLLIERVYRVVQRVFQRTIILSSRHENIEGIDAPIYNDMLPMRGTLVGIVSALMVSSDPYVFVLACDMPFVSEEALDYMISQVHGEDVVVPRLERGYEPLHAIYNKSCMAPMLRAISRENMKISDVFPFLFVRELGDNPCFKKNGMSIFANLNTEKDLELLVPREGSSL